MDVWHDYLQHFQEHFDPNGIRAGCEPLIRTSGAAKNGIVLVHGLTDSPHFMRAVGQCFVSYGFNVYLPLLQCHGLVNPNGMRGVSLEAWKKNVTFAVDRCRQECDQVSIGGLSTGGALSAWKALTDSGAINGGLFLFSAALDLAGRTGNIKAWLSRSLVGKAIDWIHDADGNRLVGNHPYRYQRMDIGGAGELARLMKHLGQLTGARAGQAHVNQPVFIAHSDSDETADIQGVRAFYNVCKPDRRTFYNMCTDDRVKVGGPDRIKHAEVVLQEPVKDEHGQVLENPNPLFDDMMAEIEAFVGRHLI